MAVLPKRTCFRGRDGKLYSITRMELEGAEGLQVDRSDPEDSAVPIESFFIPRSELEDLLDALKNFI